MKPLRYCILKKTIFYYLALLFCLISCTEEKEISYSDIPTLTPLEQVGNLRYNDYFSDITYTVLQNDNRKNSVYNPSQVRVIGQNIYIFEAGNPSRLLVFNLAGNHLFTIEKTGVGPDEITFGVDFIVDHQHEKIEILDNRGKILVFDETGNYLFSKSIQDKKQFYNFVKLNDGSYIFSTLNLDKSQPPYSIYHANQNLQITKKELPTPIYLQQFSVVNKTLSRNGDDIFFHQAGNNILYQYDGAERAFKPIFRVPLNGEWVTEEDLVACSLRASGGLFQCQSDLFNAYDKVSHFDRVVFNEDIIAFQYTLEGRNQYALYDRKKQTFKLFNRAQNDMDGGPTYPLLMAITDNALVFTTMNQDLVHSRLHDFAENNKTSTTSYDSNFPNIAHRYQSQTENNPLMVFTTIK